MNVAEKMDRQYRYQRYVYDLSRKYYLLGRDRLLNEIPLKEGDHVLEIGCGTARNLHKLAKKSTSISLYGVDASQQMLDTAQKTLQSRNYHHPITLKQGLAEEIHYRDFGLEQPFDHVIFSYVLSMVPNWQVALSHSLTLLKPNGYLHIVDFSDQQAMPSWFRSLLLKWLAYFHVHPRPEILHHLQQLAEQHNDQLRSHHLWQRYSLFAHYQKKGLSDKSTPLPFLF